MGDMGAPGSPGTRARLIEAGGLRVHAEVLGSGEPAIVLLHGFGASTFSWREVLPALARHGTAVAFDRPGFGLTPRPAPARPGEPDSYGDRAQSDLVWALVDALGLRHAVLVGHSAGAVPLLLAALASPNRVAAVVLVAPFLRAAHGPRGRFRAFLRWGPLRAIGPFLVRLVVRRLGRVLDLAWHDPRRLTREVREGYLRALAVRGWERGFWEFLTAERTPAPAGLLSRLRCPVLFVSGDGDRIVPDTERLAASVPGAELAVIPGCGHLPHEECPAAFLEAVERFLRQHRAGGAADPVGSGGRTRPAGGVPGFGCRGRV